jgi:signal peptidase
MGTMLLRQVRRTVGLVWVAILFALLGLVAINFLGPKLGYEIFVIRGGSMAPAILLGALVAAEPVNAGTLAVGDVVSVRAQNSVVYTHRIVAIDTSGAEQLLQLRGDANASPDAALVPASSVIGRVSFSAPALGFVIALIGLPSGIVSIMSALASLLLAYWLLEDLEREARSEPGPGSDPHPTTPNPVPLTPHLGDVRADGVLVAWGHARPSGVLDAAISYHADQEGRRPR